MEMHIPPCPKISHTFDAPECVSQTKTWRFAMDKKFHQYLGITNSKFQLSNEYEYMLKGIKFKFVV